MGEAYKRQGRDIHSSREGFTAGRIIAARGGGLCQSEDEIVVVILRERYTS